MKSKRKMPRRWAKRIEEVQEIVKDCNEFKSCFNDYPSTWDNSTTERYVIVDSIETKNQFVYINCPSREYDNPWLSSLYPFGGFTSLRMKANRYNINNSDDIEELSHDLTIIKRTLNKFMKEFKLTIGFKINSNK